MCVCIGTCVISQSLIVNTFKVKLEGEIASLLGVTNVSGMLVGILL